ncbi:hypothetical protein DFJ74DRAFT_694853 [Hyaloraphidium curvatum]|nr:hypothetical protein DFJ74DRAFT_694853 [Hyaloraphidium curvatum]
MLRLPTEYAAHRITYSTCVDYGSETVVAEVGGKGAIRRIFLVTGVGTHPARPQFCTYTEDAINMTLRIYFDGDAEPSVETPLGPLFGRFHPKGDDWGLPLDTPVVQSTSNGAHTLSVPMPFERGARVTLQNDSPPAAAKMRVWIQTAVHAYPASARVDPLRFRAVYRREPGGSAGGRLHRLGHARGRGFVVGLTLGFSSGTAEDNWYHGGGEVLMLDGEAAHPRVLKGTGGEDLFGESCWTTRPFGHADQGMHHSEFGDLGPQFPVRGAAYRFYLSDRIPFRTSFVFDMGRLPENDVATVLMFYHSGPRDRIVSGVPPAPSRYNGTASPALDLPVPFWSRYAPDHPRAVLIPEWLSAGPFPAATWDEFGKSWPPERGHDPAYSERLTFFKFRDRATEWHRLRPAYGWLHLGPRFFPSYGEAKSNEAQPMFAAAYILANITGPAGPARLRVVHDDWVRCWLDGRAVFEARERFGFGAGYADLEMAGGRQLLVCKVANLRNANGRAWAVLVEVERTGVGREYAGPPGWEGVGLAGAHRVVEGACGEAAGQVP